MEKTAIYRMEKALAWVLRIGVILSGVLIIMGISLMFITKDTSNPYGVMELEWILRGNSFFAPSHILFLGYTVLLSTPVLRVGVSILLYLKAHDIPFTAITLIVFVILIVSMAIGIG
jgi:uncharacterized membrane protein